MRASLYLIGFAAASLATAGLFEAGCSSSSNNGTPAGNDSGADDSSTTDDSSTVACTPLDAGGAKADTIDGGAGWGCIQAACNATAFTACGNDCMCNNAILESLVCIATDAGSPTGCFTMYLGQVTSSAVTPTISCLEANTMRCTGIAPPSDGGTEAGTPEAGGEDSGSDSGPVDSGSPADAGADADAG
jgi:hypothetical protein